MSQRHASLDTRKLTRIRTALRTPGKEGFFDSYKELLGVVVKIDQTGDITNHDLNKLRRVLEQLGQIGDVLDEGRKKPTQSSN